MRTIGQFVTLLLLIGFVGAYFWPIALTAAAAVLTYRLVLNAALSADDDKRRMSRVSELKRIYAEGGAAAMGDRNPYRGQVVNAAVWMRGYRRMLREMIARSQARQSYLRNRKEINSADQ